MSVLQKILKNPDYKDVWVDRQAMMRSIGIDLDGRTYVDLSALGPTELFDLLTKTVMWEETLNEALTNAEEKRDDTQVDADAVYNKVLTLADTKNVAQAKASAESNPTYISIKKQVNTLKAYVGYLERGIKNISKWHYVIKLKIESSNMVERKY